MVRLSPPHKMDQLFKMIHVQIDETTRLERELNRMKMSLDLTAHGFSPRTIGLARVARNRMVAYNGVVDRHSVVISEQPFEIDHPKRIKILMDGPMRIGVAPRSILDRRDDSGLFLDLTTGYIITQAYQPRYIWDMTPRYTRGDVVTVEVGEGTVRLGSDNGRICDMTFDTSEPLYLVVVFIGHKHAHIEYDGVFAKVKMLD